MEEPQKKNEKCLCQHESKGITIPSSPTPKLAMLLWARLTANVYDTMDRRGKSKRKDEVGLAEMGPIGRNKKNTVRDRNLEKA